MTMTRAPFFFAALLATPALPCSPAIDDLLSAGLIVDGETGVPTRVHVAFSPIGVFDTVQIVDADDVDGPPVATVTLTGESGLAGLVTLAPDRRYHLVAQGLPDTVTFSTGAGEDTIAPEAPEVALDVIHRGPEVLPFFDSCGGGGFDGGSTRIDVLVATTPDTAGVIARDPDSGAVLRHGRDTLTFVDTDGGSALIEVVAVDRAGNESEPVPVTLDFGGPGGCSQGGAGDMGVGVAGLALLLVRRRRHPRTATSAHM
jgi:MYXO-CTERM domain-containing protein